MISDPAVNNSVGSKGLNAIDIILSFYPCQVIFGFYSYIFCLSDMFRKNFRMLNLNWREL